MTYHQFKDSKSGRDHRVSIFFRRRGRDLLILLHGLGGSKSNFKAVAEAPVLSDVSLLSFDFLGYGHSDRPEAFDYTMEAQARVCAHIIRSYPGFRYHLAAHSMAGAIALLLPEDILLQAATFASLEGNLVAEDCFLSRKVAQMDFDAFKRTLMPRMKEKLAGDPALMADLNMADPLAFYKSCQSLVQWSDSNRLMEKFRTLPVRKAYFFGERNAGIEPLKMLQDMERIQIDRSGHLMMLDNPGDFSRKLFDFIKID